MNPDNNQQSTSELLETFIDKQIVVIQSKDTSGYDRAAASFKYIATRTVSNAWGMFMTCAGGERAPNPGLFMFSFPVAVAAVPLAAGSGLVWSCGRVAYEHGKHVVRRYVEAKTSQDNQNPDTNSTIYYDPEAVERLREERTLAKNVDPQLTLSRQESPFERE